MDEWYEQDNWLIDYVDVRRQNSTLEVVGIKEHGEGHFIRIDASVPIYIQL